MTPFYSDDWLTLYGGDCREVLASLPADSVDCVVTSPPYWGLRDYGTATWEGGDAECDHVAPPRGGRGSSNLTTDQRQERYLAKMDREYQFTHVCGKCGATRIDSQLGLERTPEEYVANMVAVFREVRRVLKPSGTCWLNLGDSYANGGSARGIGRLDQGNAIPRMDGRTPSPAGGKTERSYQPVEYGLAQKQLVGIPWRVAFALQQPYYTGRIKDERDRIWLAAMVEAEGCIHIHRRPAGQSAYSKHVRKDGTTANYQRTQDTFGVMVSVDNTHKALVDRCAEIAGQGSRYTHEKGAGKSNRKQTLYRWTVTGQQARDLLRELYPHLIGKQQQARIAYSSPSSGDGAMEAQEAIKALHAGQEVALDYPEPPTLFEPGWYLRSDIVWGKPNPMPESVTDRPTKSHEMIFLLTKQPRYYFDADAVREKWADERNGNPGSPSPKAARIPGQTPHTFGTTEWRSDGLAGRNIRSVWTIATRPYPGAHFAVFPPELPERCIKAGSSERGVCPECGAPWERVREFTGELYMTPDMYGRPRSRVVTTDDYKTDGDSRKRRSVASGEPSGLATRVHRTVGWRTTCACFPAPPFGDSCPACGESLVAHECDGIRDLERRSQPEPAVILDPFGGSGTVGMVANRLSRRAILIDLNPEYLKQQMTRNSQVPLGLTEGDAA